jgi:dimethylhistidine N-methyltransferase
VLDRVDARAAQREAFRLDVLEGLSRPQKTLPSRWLYDDRGSELFEEITNLPEYYPTRTERGILEAHATEMAALAGEKALLIEYGAGAGIKTEILITAIGSPAAYVPIDIAGDFLAASARRIERRFPYVEIRPVVADFTQVFDLPDDLPKLAPRVAFFPGSTIGNLTDEDAVTFLAQIGRHVGRRGTLILGADRRKSPDILIPAYDDAAGVTAEFNRNLLRRVNRELGGDFDLAAFRHEARWNEARSAIEMHLVSTRRQTACVDGRTFRFGDGETIHTEDSRKYSLDALEAMAERAGWLIEHVWQDERELFAVLGLRFS